MRLITLPLSVALAALPYLSSIAAQEASSSTSGSDQTSSAAPSVSGTPGGGGAGSPGSTGGFQLQEYLTFLNDSGYTALSSAIEQANQTENGQAWLTQLSNGRWTVFAPTNEAFSSVPQNVSSDPNVLADYLSYHYVYNDLQNMTAAATGNGNGNGGGGGVGGGGGGGGGSGTGTCSSTGTGACRATSTGQSSSASQSASSESGSNPTPTPGGTSGSAFGLRRLFGRQQGGNGGSNGGGQNSGNDQLYSGIYPDDSIGRTLLSSPQYVRLEGNKDQVLAWTRFAPDQDITILNQMTGDNQNVTVANGTIWQNLNIVEVNGVFIPPGNISEALAANNDQPLIDIANQIQVPGPDGQNISAIQALQQARGFTLFAPAAEAFSQEVNSILQGLTQSDPQSVGYLLDNHYINGSTVYAPTLFQIADNSTNDDSEHRQLVSAGGQYFSFSTNDTGLFVSVGNDSMARVIRPDVLVENGVIHIIDTVLFRTDNNPDYAGAAFTSAEATQSASDTAAIFYPTLTVSNDNGMGGGAGGGGGMGSMMSSGSSSGAESASSTESSSNGRGSSGSTSSDDGSGASPTPSSFRVRRAIEI